MVRVLRKVIEKRINCPKCGCELSFDDSDEKYSFSFSIPRFDESTSICCPCWQSGIDEGPVRKDSKRCHTDNCGCKRGGKR